MKDVVGYKHIEVDNLSQIEVNTLLKYYKNKMWITRGYNGCPVPVSVAFHFLIFVSVCPQSPSIKCVRRCGIFLRAMQLRSSSYQIHYNLQIVFIFVSK